MKTKKCWYCKQEKPLDKKYWATFYACKDCALAYAEAHPKIVNFMRERVFGRGKLNKTIEQVDNDPKIRRKAMKKLLKDGYTEDEIKKAWEEMRK